MMMARGGIKAVSVTFNGSGRVSWWWSLHPFIGTQWGKK
jgi:hypothetical protein